MMITTEKEYIMNHTVSSILCVLLFTSLIVAQPFTRITSGGTVYSYSTLQAAINATQSGDVVNLYNQINPVEGKILITNKNNVTIIGCESDFVNYNLSDTNIVLRGCSNVFIMGLEIVPADSGIGIYINSSSNKIQIANCTFGGFGIKCGIKNRGSNTLIDNNSFDFLAYGIDNESSMTVTNSMFIVGCNKSSGGHKIVFNSCNFAHDDVPPYPDFLSIKGTSKILVANSTFSGGSEVMVANEGSNVFYLYNTYTCYFDCVNPQISGNVDFLP